MSEETVEMLATAIRSRLATVEQIRAWQTHRDVCSGGELRELSEELMAMHVTALRDIARPRDARTEPPENDQRVLLFGLRLMFGPDGRFYESEWVIDYFLVEGDMRGWMWGRYPEDHLWLPLPPAPEVE